MFDLETGKKYVFLGFLKVSLSFETNACTLFFHLFFLTSNPKICVWKSAEVSICKGSVSVSNLKLNSTSQIIS